MQTYETLFITTPTLTEEEERSTVDTLSQIITDGGGSMVANDRMGRRRLAYPIEKQTDGVYIRFLYDAEADVPKELERRIGISDRVLRALTVRLETKWAIEAKAQAVRDAQARVEAAERERLEKEEAAKRAAEAPEEASAEPATETSAQPATEASAEPATETSAQPATEASARPATEASAQPAEASAPAAKEAGDAGEEA